MGRTAIIASVVAIALIGGLLMAIIDFHTELWELKHLSSAR